MIKNLAQLKRAMVLGSKWRAEILPGAIFQNWAGTDLRVVDREVRTVQTNGVFLSLPDGRDSWLEFGKAEFWQFEDGQAILLNSNKEPAIRYAQI